MKYYCFTVLSAIILLFLSCNKDDDEVSISDRSQALLGQWNYSAITTDKAVDINGDGTVNIDLFNTQEIRQCLKDNLTFFTEMDVIGAGEYSINENELACDENDPFSTIERDSYQLIDNQTIQFEARNDMRIIELTKSKLVIETNDNLGDENVIVTISFQKN